MPERTKSKRPTKKTTKSSKTKKAVAEVAAVEVPDVADVVLETEQDVRVSAVAAIAVSPDDLKTDDVLDLIAPSTTRRTRASRESVLAAFDTLLESISEEIVLTRTEKKRLVPLKTFKTLLKDLKSLRTDVSRIVKGKRRVNESSNNKSGFMKPVRISKAMAKFTSWDATNLYSRVDVTRFICNYVKENNLQNPEDKRQWNPDKKLAKLLAYDASNEEPMTYCYLQKKIQPHFQSVKVD
jgi:chromatin remodeling complex protein RSC6